jgi:uncharacterized protein (DUF779 family)
MKTKKYFLLVISFLLIFSLFYSSTNSISSVSDTAIDKKNDYEFTQLVANLEQETSSTPQLSQTFSWDDNGTVISNAPQNQYDQQICYDGAGGAIITWRDYRNGNADIYAQKINSAGDTQWADNGTVICNDRLRQLYPQICCDGAEGAIITWRDLRSDDGDIYAQKIDSAGVTQWGNSSTWGGLPDRNGTVICNATLEQYDPQICYNNTEGAIITWQDLRSDDGDIYAHIYAQKIDSAGDTKWGESFWSGPGDRNGTVICNATLEQVYPQICCDGAGGAIITWDDYRSGTNSDIYAQKIDSAGDTQWTDNGTVICNATLEQEYTEICCDGAEGAIITWYDKRSGNLDIYAQKIDSAGDTKWGESFWSGPGDRNGTVI